MKTLVKTLFASSLALVLASSTVLSVHAENAPSTTVAQKPLSFKRIKVSGNVELTIVQGNRTAIEYSDASEGKVKITQVRDGIDVVSANDQVAKVTVYTDDLYRISAANHAKVKTSGQLKVQYLQVFLSGQASLELNSKTESLYTVIEDQSDLKLSGSTGEHTLSMGKSQKLIMDKFAANTTTIVSPMESEFAILSK
ncbi:GIN domain-containing protein [Pedobacter sp. AW1-32]|uniref:GIN domain-containing protein n=1 Tax=Pedobacter sp. AW1-32 TaxID=3383026 RepID=UPI003FED98D8